MKSDSVALVLWLRWYEKYSLLTSIELHNKNSFPYRRNMPYYYYYLDSFFFLFFRCCFYYYIMKNQNYLCYRLKQFRIIAVCNTCFIRFRLIVWWVSGSRVWLLVVVVWCRRVFFPRLRFANGRYVLEHVFHYCRIRSVELIIIVVKMLCWVCCGGLLLVYLQLKNGKKRKGFSKCG